jgi:hypothetical protein
MCTESVLWTRPCVTLQPNSSKLTVLGMAFLWRKRHRWVQSICNAGLHVRFPSLSAPTLYSKHSRKGAAGDRVSLTSVEPGISSSGQQADVGVALELNSAAQGDTKSATTRHTDFSQNAASLESCSSAPKSNSATTNNHPQLCPVCGLKSSNSCFSCAQDFCPDHLYVCVDCRAHYCRDCSDAHFSDGHWGDSDTASELAHAQHIGRGLVHCQRDLNLSLPDAIDQPHHRPWWPTLQSTLRSLLALVVRRRIVIQAEVCL